MIRLTVDVNFSTGEAVAYFVNTHFEEVSFENTQFHGKAIFTKVFCEKTSGSQGHFYKWEEGELINYYTGVAIFTNAIFFDELIFNRAKVRGIALFDNTIFYNNVNFQKSQFKVKNYKSIWKSVRYEGKVIDNGMSIRDNSVPSD